MSGDRADAEQNNVINLGGTMRLGSYPCILKDGTLAPKAVWKKEISERHRHRYEVNNAYRECLIQKVCVFPDCRRTDGSWRWLSWRNILFIATQAHPEFKSRPNHAHPSFPGPDRRSRGIHYRQGGGITMKQIQTQQDLYSPAFRT